jgi:hypothetical protein
VIPHQSLRRSQPESLLDPPNEPRSLQRLRYVVQLTVYVFVILVVLGAMLAFLAGLAAFVAWMWS